jgi:hypothetical protein
VSPISRRMSSLMAVALILGACSHSGEAGLRDGARTAIARFGETIQSLHRAAALTGGSGAPEQVAPVAEDGVATGATFILDRIAEARRDVMNSIEPLGDSGAVAVLRAVQSEVANSRRRIAEMAGAIPDGPGRFVLAPAKILVLTELTAEQVDESVKELDVRNDDPDIKRVVIRGDIDADLFALACEALLADAGARERLAPKRSPDDLPDVTPQLADELGIGSTTRLDWQQAIFDDQAQLILTPSGDVRRYTLLMGWAEKVNPQLGRVAHAFLNRMIRQ